MDANAAESIIERLSALATLSKSELDALQAVRTFLLDTILEESSADDDLGRRRHLTTLLDRVTSIRDRLT